MAVDKSGRVAASSHRAWDYFEPEGLEMYGKEFDPESFQDIIAECCREVIARTGAHAVKAVTTTGMRQGCVFVDDAGSPIYGGPNRDVRGIVYAGEVEQLLGEERTFQITGRWPPWMFVPARLYWFREEQPETFNKISRVLMINDWLIHWLCGRAAGEPTNAAESMLLDINTRQWSAEMLEASGVSADILPEVLPCGETAGEVSEKAAKITGLAEGAKVITGMADTQAALIAGAVMKPGDCGVVAGSTTPVMIVTDEPVRDPETRVWTGCHPLPGRWVAESNAGDSGLVYRWYVEGHLGALAGPETSPYAAVEAWAEKAGPGAEGARAFLGPMIWDLKNIPPTVKAALALGFPLTRENAGPGNLARAILENIAFAVRANLEQASRVAGDPGRVALMGGMTRSGLFRRIIAGVLGRPVEVVAEAEATAIGCAAFAFAALGAYSDPEAAVIGMSGGRRTVEPDSEDKEEYNDLFEQWLEEYPAMMGMSPSDDDW